MVSFVEVMKKYRMAMMDSFGSSTRKNPFLGILRTLNTFIIYWRNKRRQIKRKSKKHLVCIQERALTLPPPQSWEFNRFEKEERSINCKASLIKVWRASTIFSIFFCSLKAFYIYAWLYFHSSTISKFYLGLKLEKKYIQALYWSVLSCKPKSGLRGGF